MIEDQNKQKLLV